MYSKKSKNKTSKNKTSKNKTSKNKTIISPYLSGGIGNQMFQISAAYSYCLNNSNSKLIIECPKLLGPGHKQKLNNNYKILQDIITDVFPNIKCTNELIKWDNIVKQKRNKWYDNIPLNKYIRKNETNKLVGIFASYIYFKGNDQKIKNLFKFSNNIIDIANKKFKNIIDNTKTISLHFRRGDKYKLVMRNLKSWCIVELEYYYKAIDLFLQNHYNYTFVIFNEKIDDKWILKHIIPYLLKKNQKYIHVGYNVPSVLSLYLISKCKNNIISNSTFSFWGAYLNNNNEKIVYSPQIYKTVKNPYKLAMYLRGNIMSSKKEIRLPNNWIKIDTKCIK